jgi:hypothetical protein
MLEKDLELVKEGTTFVTLFIIGLEIVDIVALVAIVLGTFILVIKSLVLVVGMAVVTIAFFDFVSFAFNF